MASVRARVLAWLATHDITARTADVRDELRKLTDEGLVVVESRGADPRAQRRVYRSAPIAQDGHGRPCGDLSGALAALSGRPEPTHCDQILSLLADGTVWSSHELHRRVFCILHSRIADLRKKLRPLGFDVEHTGGGAGTDEHHYRLVQVAPLSAPSPMPRGSRFAAGSLSSDDGGDGALSGVTAEPPGAALHHDAQLSLSEAA